MIDYETRSIIQLNIRINPELIYDNKIICIGDRDFYGLAIFDTDITKIISKSNPYNFHIKSLILLPDAQILLFSYNNR